jgi:hypothetical protein
MSTLSELQEGLATALRSPSALTTDARWREFAETHVTGGNLPKRT